MARFPVPMTYPTNNDDVLADDMRALLESMAACINSIEAEQMGTESVESAAIKNLNVTTAKLADSSVTTIKIADENVTMQKLAPSGFQIFDQGYPSTMTFNTNENDPTMVAGLGQTIVPPVDCYILLTGQVTLRETTTSQTNDAYFGFFDHTGLEWMSVKHLFDGGGTTLVQHLALCGRGALSAGQSYYIGVAGYCATSSKSMYVQSCGYYGIVLPR